MLFCKVLRNRCHNRKSSRHHPLIGKYTDYKDVFSFSLPYSFVFFAPLPPFYLTGGMIARLRGKKPLEAVLFDDFAYRLICPFFGYIEGDALLRAKGAYKIVLMMSQRCPS